MEKYNGNYRFLVCIGSTRISFAKVGGLETSIDYDTIQIGGINHTVYTTPSPKKQVQTITFERAVQSEDSFILDIKPGMWLGERMEIFILDDFDQSNSISYKYYIEDGLITKWELTPLNALGNEVLINKFELIHNGLYQDF